MYARGEHENLGEILFHLLVLIYVWPIWFPRVLEKKDRRLVEVIYEVIMRQRFRRKSRVTSYLTEYVLGDKSKRTIMLQSCVKATLSNAVPGIMVYGIMRWSIRKGS